MSELFPRGIAQGDAFYDREAERKKLKGSIENTIHTVLIAPRRYGKTSLMTHVLHENNIDYVWIDFMTITSPGELQTKLLQKIAALMVKIVPVADKLKRLLSKYFNALNPEITLSLSGVSLTLRFGKNSNDKESIEEALMALDNVAQELNLRLVIVCDEFQEIMRIDEDATMQAKIRHAAERAKAITYLFSGSKHRPLRRLFNGKENPLYALCDIFELDKIVASEYVAYVNFAAIEKWGNPLHDDVINKILSYSDRYPKYINALCGTLWAMEIEPTADQVDAIWHGYVLSRKTDITEDLSELTLNQRRLLQWLCFNPTKELYSKETLASLGLPQSSVQKAIEVLLEKGFVADDGGVYKVLDPIWTHYFTMF